MQTIYVFVINKLKITSYLIDNKWLKTKLTKLPITFYVKLSLYVTLKIANRF